MAPSALPALPEHLPRYEVLIGVEQRDCPCCCGVMHAIGELRTEQLDIVPAQLRVRVTRRPRNVSTTLIHSVLAFRLGARSCGRVD